MSKIISTSSDYQIKSGGNVSATSNNFNITANVIFNAGSINSFQFPATRGVTGYSLVTDGSGSLSWVNVSGGGGANGIAYLSANVPYSATPTFNLNANAVQYMLLGGNVTSSNVSNPLDATEYTFIIQQSANGNSYFTWPTTFNMTGNISQGAGSTSANSISVQSFIYVQFLNQFFATTPMLYNGI